VDETTASNIAAESAFAAALEEHSAGGAGRIVGGDGATARVVLTPIEGRAVLNLRTVPKPVRETFAVVLGLKLPTVAWLSAADADGRVHALWTGPGDWLITCADAQRIDLEARLRAALGGMTGALTDVGHGFAVLNLSGPAAVDVLAQGCGIDLDPTVFTEGACAMTVLARMRVLIHRLPRGGGYDVYVERSYADSLWHFVTVAAMEYGYRVGGEARSLTGPARLR
jgi:sarcosine oxidase subunit gamma